MKGLSLCTLVLEFNYSIDPAEMRGTAWLFKGDATLFLETSEESLASVSGWHKIVGPIDYQAASEIHAALKGFLESAGVSVIDEGIAD